METKVKRLPDPIYLSGPMSYYEDNNVAAFAEACFQLRQQGFVVNSPHEIETVGLDHIKEAEELWRYFMRQDIYLIVRSKSFVMLPGWECSRGARLEVAIAHALGMPVVPYHLLASPKANA